MLKNLRWRLSLLYLLVAIGLVILISSGTYLLMRYYFQQTTDQALQLRMATEFKKYDLPLPTELKLIQHQWLKNNSSNKAVVTQTRQLSNESNAEPKAQSPSVSTESKYDELGDEEYDGSISAVFVTTHNYNNMPASNPNQAPAPIEEDKSAAKSALQYGVDWRTVSLPDGTRARLLTYRTSTNSIAPDVLQVGRLLDDQDRLLKQYLIDLLTLGGISSVILALTSWWLAGRSLSPAQKAWDQQQMFVANAGHELRTPLTLIRATADFGLRSQPPENQKYILRDIINECDYMNRLVEDLLLLSRLDTKRLQLQLEPIPIHDLLTEISRQVEQLAQEKNISLVLDSTRVNVIGDRVRLRQVLLILLDNALRYTPLNGMIHIQVLPQKHYIQIVVADNGKGIPPQHLPHLFERFYQVRLPGNDNVRHNGLGLSIAKTLIEAQKGTIHIESAVNKGTRVWICLPTI